jgi:hypothetical protein
MRLKIALACALFAFTSATPFSQAPGAFTMHSTPVIVSQNITPSSYVFTFTATTTAQINGVAIKGLTFSGYAQSGPAEFHVWGVIVGELANGDQVTFMYQRVSPVRNGVTLEGTLTYKIVGGTGAAKGITGSGSCKIPQAGLDSVCAGAYAIP